MEQLEYATRVASKPLSAIAVLINALLIFIITNHSNTLLGNYKYLMIYIAVFEMSFALLDYFHVPIIVSKGSACLLMINLKENNYPSWLATFMNVLFYGFFGATMNMLCIHFIYRYAAVSGTELIQYFHSWKLLVWFTFPLINGGVWIFSACYLFQGTDFLDEFLDKQYSAKRGFRIADFSYFGAMFYPKTSAGTQYVYWKSVEGCLIILVLITVSIVTIIIFGFKCFSVMRAFVAHSSESIKYKRLQEQLFYALVLQTLIPMFLLHIPSSLTVMSLLFNSSEEWNGILLATSTAFYPAINPIPTIFIVDSYRKAIFGYLQTFKCYLLCRPVPVDPMNAPNDQMTVTQMTTVNRTV